MKGGLPRPGLLPTGAAAKVLNRLRGSRHC